MANGRKRNNNNNRRPAQNPQAAPNPRRRPRMRRGTGGVALVGSNQSTLRVNNPTGGRAQGGSDLIAALTIPSSVEQGELLVDVIVTPSVAARLETLATAWQRLKYHKLMFEVNASGSSLIGGEFVAAFIADPTDVPPLRGADRWVKAHQGSVTSSWWRSVNVHGPCPPQVMYTSYEPNEPRFSSPGRFVLAVVNPPSSDTTMSISLNWHVTFMQPSLEYTIEEDSIYVLEEDARLKLTDFSAGQPFDPHLRKGLDGKDGTAYLSPEDFTPTLPEGVMLRLPHPKTLNADTGASGAPENAIVTHMGVSIAAGSRRIAYFYSTDDVHYTQLDASLPFSIRPVADPINKKGTVYEEDVLESGNATGALARSARVPRSLTSAPALRQSSKGKLLSFQNSKRF
ncbi:capsid protein [Beihai barnacle virus 11]|uniref:capsid protein n=1 Tax=Beihai barnacle virus 11 TaxID=1922355 RepID=UPI00090B466D|nr:capsid protein [Beihai barnacle virus 11]APG76132.1 capsid protein [Beihai barnacle virus 11]